MIVGDRMLLGYQCHSVSNNVIMYQFNAIYGVSVGYTIDPSDKFCAGSTAC